MLILPTTFFFFTFPLWSTMLEFYFSVGHMVHISRWNVKTVPAPFPTRKMSLGQSSSLSLAEGRALSVACKAFVPNLLFAFCCCLLDSLSLRVLYCPVQCVLNLHKVNRSIVALRCRKQRGTWFCDGLCNIRWLWQQQNSVNCLPLGLCNFSGWYKMCYLLLN